MIQNTFLSAQELLVPEEVRAAAIVVLGRLEREEYEYFDISHPSTCVVAKMMYEMDRSIFDYAWVIGQSEALAGVYFCDFLDSRVRRNGLGRCVTQRDAAWVVRHWLERGDCPRPDQYAARHLAMPVLPDEQSLVERVPECIE